MVAQDKAEEPLFERTNFQRSPATSPKFTRQSASIARFECEEQA
jgi:hypothetical protein